MFGNKKNSDSRRTPRLDGTYNVPRYREYQSPRMRRLMRDEERQKRVRISRNYGLLIVIVIVASTIITGVAGGNAVIQMQKTDTIKKQHAPTTLISEGLQNEINLTHILITATINSLENIRNSQSKSKPKNRKKPKPSMNKKYLVFSIVLWTGFFTFTYFVCPDVLWSKIIFFLI